MRALVLGGNGFIGSHVVEALLAGGTAVRVLDVAPVRSDVRWPSGVEYISGSMGRGGAVAEALADVDLIYHLVSTTVPSTSNLDPVNDVESNLVSTVALLELMRQLDKRRIVFLSSGGTVYGNPTVSPVPESHRLSPICSYGVIKVAIEQYLGMYQHLYGFQPLVFRVSNPYGPRQGHAGIQGVVSTFLRTLAKGEPLRIWGDGSVVRDYIHVRDLARLCSMSATSDVTGVFNVGSGVGYSIRDVVQAISEATGLTPQVEYQPARGFDVSRVVLDISSVRREFGWAPQTGLVEGIREMWSQLTASTGS